MPPPQAGDPRLGSSRATFPPRRENATAVEKAWYRRARRAWERYAGALLPAEAERFVELARTRLRASGHTHKIYQHWVGKQVRQRGDWVAWLLVRDLWPPAETRRTKALCARFWAPVDDLQTDAYPANWTVSLVGATAAAAAPASRAAPRGRASPRATASDSDETPPPGASGPPSRGASVSDAETPPPDVPGPPSGQADASGADAPPPGPPRPSPGEADAADAEAPSTQEAKPPPTQEAKPPPTNPAPPPAAAPTATTRPAGAARAAAPPPAAAPVSASASADPPKQRASAAVPAAATPKRPRRDGAAPTLADLAAQLEAAVGARRRPRRRQAHRALTPGSRDERMAEAATTSRGPVTGRIWGGFWEHRRWWLWNRSWRRPRTV